MKVNIGPYIEYFGPYQLAEKLCFWVKDVEDELGIKQKPDWVFKFGEWLDGDRSIISKFLLWRYSRKNRKISIQIDSYDTWSMDSTLAIVILPMLKQLKETKHGSPHVCMEDVPKPMRLTEHEPYGAQQCFDFYNEPELNRQNIKCDVHTRWKWVLDEMIWAFEQIQPDYDWEGQYRSGTIDIVWKKLDNGYAQMVDGPNHTYKLDSDKHAAHQARITNGLSLFGKYFQGLWS
jgi:hypothetical protein